MSVDWETEERGSWMGPVVFAFITVRSISFLSYKSSLDLLGFGTVAVQHKVSALVKHFKVDSDLHPG